MSSQSKALVERIMATADIEPNGDRPWDIQIHDDGFYDRIVAHGTLGFGEAYMDGWWDAQRLDETVFRLLRSKATDQLRPSVDLMISVLRGKFFNMQRLRKMEVGQKHYDLGNDLYELMLDDRMIYSCGYWKDVETLEEAQDAKLDLICRKVGLEPGMRILDIGSGWGGFMRFAAERYGVEAVGVTISKEQAEFANSRGGNLPVETRLMDYMDLDGKFDRIISIGMFEHVGYKNYRPYMNKARELLDDNGYFLLHTIGGNTAQTTGDPWVLKYIFPHGMVPSPEQMGAAIEGNFVIEDWHNFGPYYDNTLLAWLANFDEAWPKLKDKYGDRFQRMWRYYLQMFAGSFRAREIQLWQLVLSPSGTPGGYESIR